MVSTGPNGRKEGLYLVRDSLRIPGSFVLTIWALNQVHHFQIVGHGEGWFSVDNGPLFEGIDQLIIHYKVVADGLPSKLQKFIIGTPPPLWAVSKREDTEYHKAARNGDVGLLKQLLSRQSSGSYLAVNSPNPDGFTPVHEAAKNGQTEVLRMLLKHNPAVDIGDTTGTTAVQVINP